MFVKSEGDAVSFGFSQSQDIVHEIHAWVVANELLAGEPEWEVEPYPIGNTEIGGEEGLLEIWIVLGQKQKLRIDCRNAVESVAHEPVFSLMQDCLSGKIVDGDTEDLHEW